MMSDGYYRPPRGDRPSPPPNPPNGSRGTGAGPARANRTPADGARPPSGGSGDGGKFAAFRARRKVRRRAKKARIRAMPRSRRYLRRGMITGTWFLGLIAVVMVGAIVAYFAFTDVPRPESLPLPQVATIEYSDGSTLARIGSVDRTIVELDQVPKSARYAVLAAEDRGFYTESAVSITGTVRAALSDVTGGSTQGGSGITQQYVKNAYLDDAPTLSRKLKELMIAVKLSREYSKDQILDYYLNTVYFGRGAYGIEAAAEAFFGEHVEKLTTSQGAMLAALLRAPSYYDPASNRTAAVGRWHYVLDGMVQTGHLTQAAADTMPFPTTKKPKPVNLGTTGWKYLLVNAVLNELARNHISAREVRNRGLTIRTTIDRKAQSAAVKAIDTNFAHLTKKQKNLKNSLVAVDPSNGGVLAYYGGSGPGVQGYDGKIDYNDWASQRANPPGSSFKPYVLATVLTQTLEQTPGKDHFAINSDVPGDLCRNIQGTKICNDPGDKTLSAPRVKLSNALKWSLNTTFDLLALDAGPENVAEMAHRLGVATNDSDGNPTLQNAQGQTGFGIGIGDYPVTTLDQANGYATLADKGVPHGSYMVDHATASDGQRVYTHGESTPAQPIDPRVANDVTLAMKPIAGYNNSALADGRKSAAKTGTEGIGNTTNNSDAWMVGFTPQVSAAVWVGTGYRDKPIYDSNGNPEYGRDLPGQTWKTFMDDYLQGKKFGPFPSKQQIGTDGLVPTPKPTLTTSSNTSSSSSSSSSSSTSRSNPPNSPTPPKSPPSSKQSPPATKTSSAPKTSPPPSSRSSSGGR